MSAAGWELERRPDGAGVLWADQGGEKVNILSSTALSALDAILDGLSDGGDLKTLVFASRKPGVFIAGADVKEIYALCDERAAHEMVRRAQRTLDKIARLPIPTVAAVEGVCLGGGLELALACGHRVVSEHPKTELGLVEVRLGVIPGFGGTQRLPRLVGLRESLRMILNGSTVRPRKALKIGLADACVPAGAAVEEAVALGLRASSRKLPRPTYRPRGPVDWLLESTPVGSAIVFRKSLAALARATRGHYPAPLAALEAVREGRGLAMEKALEVEARLVVPLAVSPVCKNLIRLFFMTEAAKKPTAAERDAGLPPTPRVGILGAGVMGGAIAQLAAARGMAVRLKDIREEFLGKGLAEAARLFKKAVERGRMRSHEAAAAMARISPALGYEGFSTLDLVVEAVVEKLEVKRAVLAEVEKVSGGKALFASNTSSLQIASICRDASRPELVVGLHFFNPVEKMPLVEVIRGPRTGDGTMAAALGLARRLGKVPVVCKDGPGFLVNRLLMPYLNESAYLLLEGAGPEMLDQALLDFGMPMGPARLLDEVGLDTVTHVGAILEAAFPDRMPGCPLLKGLFEAKLLGKKGGAGFYLYRDGRRGAVNPAAAKLLPPSDATMTAEALVERTVLPMINEATRILDEGIVSSEADVDLAMVLGTGFPPFRGGLLRYADTLGLPHIAERLAHLAASVGPRFAPAPRILSMAEAGSTFFRAGD